jgi:catechol 2,3-dioxygenase-like lactoylglutathione lyase family enzyme
MSQSVIHVALVVRDYDEAITFYCGTLNFTLVEDTYQPEQDKRWVVVAPPGSLGTSLLLARASTPEQSHVIGRQSGGRVFLFLGTDDFWRDYERMRQMGIHCTATSGTWCNSRGGEDKAEGRRQKAEGRGQKAGRLGTAAAILDRNTMRARGPAR